MKNLPLVRSMLKRCAFDRWNGDRWLSEREWIAECRDEIATYTSAGADLELRVTDENIDDLEKTSCAEIMVRLTEETEIAVAGTPSHAELRSFCADPNKSSGVRLGG